MTLRTDLALISDWISPGSRVLDLGCGDGTLLAHLQAERDVRGYGLEIDDANIVACMRSHLNVVQRDLNEGLYDFRSDAFDYLIMTQTLQAVRYPDRLLKEMLRIGREGIVTFPNFAHWRARLCLAMGGRMPVSRALPNEWYNTPNIHLCTIKDFENLCRKNGIRILDRAVVDVTHRETGSMRLAPNLLGEIAIYRLCQQPA